MAFHENFRIFLLVFFIIHVIHAASILDRLTWGQLLLVAYSPTGFIILSVMVSLGTFHTINGIRLMFNQGGIGVGTPRRQDYPYSIQSVNKKIACAFMSQLVFQHWFCIMHWEYCSNFDD